MTGRPFATLSQALAAHRIPIENHALIRTFTDEIGIAGYWGMQGYIKAERRGAGPALNINPGWTNGFRSREEVLRAIGELQAVVGDDGVWTSDRGTDQWGVSHPLNRIGQSGPEVARQERDYGTCPQCFCKFAANGTCQCD